MFNSFEDKDNSELKRREVHSYILFLAVAKVAAYMWTEFSNIYFSTDYS